MPSAARSELNDHDLREELSIMMLICWTDTIGPVIVAEGAKAIELYYDPGSQEIYSKMKLMRTALVWKKDNPVP